jgi:hypothetical protein
MLVIYMVNPPRTEFKVATKIAVKEMGKIEEYEHFKKNNIPCLPIERFKWGMELDPAIYGDWVVLKPEFIQSTGKDVNMVPTKEIPNLKLKDFPESHLIHQDSYLVQRFVNTGKNPCHYRVCVFLDEVIYSRISTLRTELPEQDETIDALLRLSVATNFRPTRDVSLIKDVEINDFALKLAKTYPSLPILGIDILKDVLTGELFILETNSGGNVWHFSSAQGRGVREDLGGRHAYIRQYNAWDRAAEALVNKTNLLAS